MKTTIGRGIIGLFAVSIASLACAGTASSPVDAHWGEAQRNAQSGMVANPEAGSEAKPAEGLAASTAEDVTEYYHQRQTPGHQNGARDSMMEQLED